MNDRSECGAWTQMMIYFIAWVVISSLLILQLVVAVLIDNFTSASEKARRPPSRHPPLHPSHPPAPSHEWQ